MTKGRSTKKEAPINDAEELAAADMIPEKDVVTIIGTDQWKGNKGKEHVVSGNVANAIIGKGWATLK